MPQDLFLKRFNLYLLIILIFLTLSTSSELRGIVDGGGYALKPKSNDSLALHANPPSLINEPLGHVTLEPSDNSPNQHWGAEFFGSPTASLTPASNRNNNITLYLPQSSSKFQTRQYSFIQGDGLLLYKIKSKENGLCIGSTLESKIVTFLDCDSKDEAHLIQWIFQRTG